MSNLEDSITPLRAIGATSLFAVLFGAFWVIFPNPSPDLLPQFVSVIVGVVIIAGLTQWAWDAVFDDF